ncbi:MAG: hypothetical protein EXR97_01550 [Nitrospiraceae bacterium]|nr:hypothetical protein [Nitrospiraceae bacterium]MSR24396.1 hypothetical protein [Nitrospiraceae bacterium]
MLHQPQRLCTLATLLIAAGLFAWPAGESLAQPKTHPEAIEDAHLYFPDTIGSRWRYRGRIEEWPLQKISETKSYVNVSTVSGTQTINGVTVMVFHDTNLGNHGPTDSYSRRDAVGVVYYGSSPGTPVERQVIPYQIVRFPIAIPSSFQQFDRKGVDFGTDVDGDGTQEKVDVDASVTVAGKESVSVPAGSYANAVRMEARMSLRIHLSKSRRSVVSTDVLTAWFAKGVGLVKYTEHQEMPPAATDRGWITEITEELEEAEVKTLPAAIPTPSRQ